jgi:hypothetical protein
MADKVAIISNMVSVVSILMINSRSGDIKRARPVTLFK